MRMSALTLVTALCVTTLIGCASTQSAAPVLGRTIELSGVHGSRPNVGVPGRLDHLAYDPATDRLFVAALENNSLEVIDLATGERVKSIPDLPHPQGIAVVSTAGRVAVGCGGDGLVHVFDTRTLEETNTVKAGPGADNVRYDAKANTIYVANRVSDRRSAAGAPGVLTAVDAATWEVLRPIEFTSRPESFQLDPNSARIFANVPGGLRATADGVVRVVDRNTGAAVAEITLPDRARNYPMAFDPVHERLFTVCRRPARLIAIDTRAYRVITEAKCTDDSDDLFYDAQTDRVIVICGGYRPDFDDDATRPANPPSEMGTIDVFAVGPAGGLRKIAETPTARHARTGYFVPTRRAIYVAVPPQDGHDAQILEFKVSD